MHFVGQKNAEYDVFERAKSCGGDVTNFWGERGAGAHAVDHRGAFWND